VIDFAQPLSLDRQTECLVAAYMTAKERVIGAGFAPEIDWQDQVDFNKISEQNFLRELAWVIFSSGMREAVVRKKFPGISKAFLHWVSAQMVASRADHCRKSAMSVFAHKGKVEAIITVAREISRLGFNRVHRRIREEGVTYLQSFPFLGPATSYHLAKNLGLNVVKPDRHLVRLAAQAGYSAPNLMCRRIADAMGDKDSVVDLVLWRYATLTRNYLATFKS